MNTIAQLATIACISLGAAVGTFWIKGPPQRRLDCNPATLRPGEICLEQIPPDAKILWVDARPRSQWQRNGLPGSVLWSLDHSENLQAFEAEVAARIIETPRVIVYCGDENCGLSHQVAAQIEALQLDAEISVLHGGWRALDDAGKIPHAKTKNTAPSAPHGVTQ
ncbi:MAG: rhodanese-like domain-containing protein [Akkermansiaceae bacterium]|nr:rhodanese-like domain-containing protein [Akkermansiaceae bacterium]